MFFKINQYVVNTKRRVFDYGQMPLEIDSGCEEPQLTLEKWPTR